MGIAYFSRLFNGFYERQLFIFTTISLAILVFERFVIQKLSQNKHPIRLRAHHDEAATNTNIEVDLFRRKSNYTTLKWTYLAVYSIVIWADWLQVGNITHAYRTFLADFFF